MNKFKLSLAMIASALCLSVGGVASAHEAGDAYLTDSKGDVVKNGFGMCWRTSEWTPAREIAECGGVKAEPGKCYKTTKTNCRQVAEGPAASKIQKLTLDEGVSFEFNKSFLLDLGHTSLDDFAAKLKKFAEVQQVQVSGYTDYLGSDKYNAMLSQERADTVRSYLIDKGIAADRIKAVGMGEANPRTQPNECADFAKSRKNRADLIACLQPDRRVELEVTAQAAGKQKMVEVCDEKKVEVPCDK